MQLENQVGVFTSYLKESSDSHNCWEDVAGDCVEEGTVDGGRSLLSVGEGQVVRWSGAAGGATWHACACAV